MKKSPLFLKRKCKTGSSVVEFALVLPIFLAVVFFLIDILRFYFIQQTLSFLVREGLRAGIVFDPENPPSTSTGTPPVVTTLNRQEVIMNAVNNNNLMRFAISFNTLGPAVSNPDVLATITPTADTPGVRSETVTLKMDYQNFVFLTPFLGLLFATQPTGSIPLSVSQSFQNEEQ